MKKRTKSSPKTASYARKFEEDDTQSNGRKILCERIKRGVIYCAEFVSWRSSLARPIKVSRYAFDALVVVLREVLAWLRTSAILPDASLGAL